MQMEYRTHCNICKIYILQPESSYWLYNLFSIFTKDKYVHLASLEVFANVMFSNPKSFQKSVKTGAIEYMAYPQLCRRWVSVHHSMRNTVHVQDGRV